MTTQQKVQLTVNGVGHEANVDPRTTLADFLRGQLELTGTHVGCEHGVCGACTVLLEGRAVRACLMLAVQADGASLTTVEGLEDNGKLHPIQEAFAKHDALQCGFCTPGFVMSLLVHFKTSGDDSRRAIDDVLAGNLCRWTGYDKLVRAVQDPAKELRQVQRKKNRQKKSSKG